MTTLDTRLTLEDVSSISARYLFTLTPEESDDIFDGLENAGVVASALLKESVTKAIDEGIAAEMIAYLMKEAKSSEVVARASGGGSVMVATVKLCANSKT